MTDNLGKIGIIAIAPDERAGKTMKLPRFLSKLPAPVRIVLIHPWFYLAVALHAVVLMLPTKWQWNIEITEPLAQDAIKVTRLPASSPASPEAPPRKSQPSPSPQTSARDDSEDQRQPDSARSPRPRSTSPRQHAIALSKPQETPSPEATPSPSPTESPSPETTPSPSPTETPSPEATPSPSPTESPSPAPGRAEYLLQQLSKTEADNQFKAIIAQVKMQWDPARDKGLMYEPDPNLLNQKEKFNNESQFELKYMTRTLADAAPSSAQLEDFLKTKFTDSSQGFDWSVAGSYGDGTVYKVTKPPSFERYVILAPAQEGRTALILTEQYPL